MLLKILHTLIWLVMAAATVYAIRAGWRWQLDTGFAYAIALIVGETAVLVLNDWKCPLTAVMERYTADRRDNFDIYLPLWVARHNVAIFGTVFALATVAILAKRWLGS